jgi:AcrR family transcriptional regulator
MPVTYYTIGSRSTDQILGEWNFRMARRNQTRERLIEGAVQVLAVEGVAGTTTRKIADAADVHLAALHYHFKDKDALLFAVLEAVTRQLEEFLDREVKPSVDLHHRIEELILAIWRLVKKTRDLQILQFEMTMHAVRRKDTAWLAEKQYHGYIEQYRRILAQQENHGLTNQQLRALAQFLLGGIDGILVQDLAMPSDSRTRESLKRLIQAGQYLAKSMAAESK